MWYDDLPVRITHTWPSMRSASVMTCLGLVIRLLLRYMPPVFANFWASAIVLLTNDFCAGVRDDGCLHLDRVALLNAATLSR